ncbi:MAG: hypothetical protein WCD89_23170 [Anaerocolumna sp.]
MSAYGKIILEMSCPYQQMEKLTGLLTGEPGGLLLPIIITMQKMPWILISLPDGIPEAPKARGNGTALIWGKI